MLCGTDNILQNIPRVQLNLEGEGGSSFSCDCAFIGGQMAIMGEGDNYSFFKPCVPSESQMGAQSRKSSQCAYRPNLLGVP
jgi:hypothetical protein